MRSSPDSEFQSAERPLSPPLAGPGAAILWPSQTGPMHEWGSASKQPGIRPEPAPLDAARDRPSPGSSGYPRRPDQAPPPFESFPATSDSPLRFGTGFPMHTRCEDLWDPAPPPAPVLVSLP